MEQRMMISGSINIKTKLWNGLLAVSILLSACGSDTSIQKTEKINIQIENMAVEALEAVTEERTVTEQERESGFKEFLTGQEGGYNEYGDQYSLIETENGEFEVMLYDKGNNVIHTEILPKLPWIEEKTDNILQVGMTGGDISSLIFYYDKERATVSPYYTESFYLRDNYVAYMENESTLVLTDIFEDGELYMEISRNFSDSWQLGGPRHSIKDVTMITLNGQNVVVLEYFEGEERELLSEIIPIDDEGEEVIFAALEEIEKEHDILQYDICVPVRHDFENAHPTVRARVESEVRDNESMSHKYGRDLEIAMDYHLFDFNGDGLDDYLLCIDRERYDGKVEHWIRIYITRQKRGDTVVMPVLWLNLPLSDQVEGNGHKQIMILDEQINGQYAIMLSGSNLILKYNDQHDWYEFCDQ